MLALALVMATVVGACSSDDEIRTNAVAGFENESAAGVDTETVDSGDGPDGEIDPEQAALDFSKCMRDEGLDFPDLGLDANGNPDIREGFDEIRAQDGIRDGFRACSEHLEGVGFVGGRAALTDKVEIQEALVEFWACVRHRGFIADCRSIIKNALSAAGRVRP